MDKGAEVDERDSDPLQALYRAEYPGMVRLAHALTGSPETAEDVVQDAFARLHGRADRLSNPVGYLRTTVVNICRDKARRSQRERRVAVSAPPFLTFAASELLDVLLKLPYRQRAVLVLRYWGDWSEAEIAEALRCRPGTVKTLASRGLSRVKEELS
jgi:DNA-directed RNA polymerase specialized sigma24 family protein